MTVAALVSNYRGWGGVMAFARPLLAALVLVGVTAPALHAHPLAPALLELRELPDQRFEVRWKTSLLTPTGSDVRPELPPHCETQGPATSERDAASVTTRFTVACGEQGLVGAALRVQGLEQSRTDALVRVVMRDGRRLRAVLNGTSAVFVVPENERAVEVFGDYLALGFEHIATGFDHLLFVLGLVLLVSDRRSLLATVTAFTLGHSVTLSLAVLGFVDFPSRLVETAIAFSIFTLAVEISRGEERGRTAMGRRPWLMAGSFGLLHGFGFAGALTEAGLPAEDIPLALFSFNVGIEVGQVLFVGCVIATQLALGPWLRRAPKPLELLPAYGIGSLAVYWCFERALA